MPRTAITLKLKMCLFLDEARYRAEKLLIDLRPLMPDADNKVMTSCATQEYPWAVYLYEINCSTVRVSINCAITTNALSHLKLMKLCTLITGVALYNVCVESRILNCDTITSDQCHLDCFSFEDLRWL